MRRVKVITGLKIEEHVAGDCVEVWKRTYSPPYLTQVCDTDQCLLSDDRIEREVLPVLKFCTRGKPDLLVAYSSEVEEALGVPIRALSKENQGLKDLVYALRTKVNQHAQTALAIRDMYRNMTLWQRIKFLFGVHPNV